MPLADPIAGFVITFAILRIVIDEGRNILRRLMDAIEPEKIDEIEDVARSVPGMQDVHDVSARWLGHNIVMELHIALAPAPHLSKRTRLAKRPETNCWRMPRVW